MKIEEYLKKYRITKVEFAKRLGVNKSTVWNYISGRTRPTVSMAKKIDKESDGLITIKELRGDDDYRKP